MPEATTSGKTGISTAYPSKLASSSTLIDRGSSGSVAAGIWPINSSRKVSRKASVAPCQASGDDRSTCDHFASRRYSEVRSNSCV
jgi:hypothetical protein